MRYKMGKIEDSTSGVKEIIFNFLYMATNMFPRADNSREESRNSKILRALLEIDKLYNLDEYLSEAQEQFGNEDGIGCKRFQRKKDTPGSHCRKKERQS